MPQPKPSVAGLRRENEDLRRQLQEAQEVLAAIRAGEVDAVVVRSPQGNRLYALEGAERPYRTFVEEMQQGAVTLSASGTILYCNRRFSAMVKEPNGTLTGRPFLDLVAPGSQAGLESLWAQAKLGRAAAELELRPLQGPPLPVFVAVNPFPAEGVPGFCVVVSDLTEQKQHEKVVAAERRVRTMLASITDAYYALDREWRFAEINGRAEQLLGKPASQLLGRVFWEVFPQNLGSEFEQQFREAVNQRDPVHFEAASRIWPGWAEVHAYPSADGLAVYFRDISARKRVEEELRRVVQRQELLAETASQLLATQDPLWTVQELCEKVMLHLDCQAFFHFVADEGAGPLRLNAYAGVPAGETQLIEGLDRGVAVGGAAAPIGLHLVAEDGPHGSDTRTQIVKTYGLQAYACHPLLSHGQVLGTLSFGTRTRSRFSAADLSLMRTVADFVAIAMQRLRNEEALREADQRKNEFLATLAHELRNPLAPIRNAAHVLTTRPQQDPLLVRVCGIIERQVETMARLVEDLLDVSRIERGKIELRRERVDLRTVVAHAAEVSRPLLEEKRHRLTLALPETPLEVDGDPMRLEQMVCNLVNNACKYTPNQGEIHVSAAREGPDAVLRVRDSGIGLAPEALKHMFELFYQVDHSMSRSGSGLGIGLSLVQRLAELHGGSASAASDGLGKGSVFTLRFPALDPESAAAPAAPPPAEGLAPGHLGHVLIVEDNEQVRESTKMLLEAAGYNVSVASDGRAGVEQALLLHPDAAIVDLGLPGLDGLEVAGRIRSTLGQRVFLVAVTGYSSGRNQGDALAAGFDVHLVKPVNPKTLIDVLNRAAREKRQG